MRVCSIDGCEKAHYGKGFCKSHWRRSKLYGDPLISHGSRWGCAVRPLEERFWEKVDKSGDCWLWTASIRGGDGYGQINVGRRPALAHRVAYELCVGPIPDGMDLDHKCRNRLCVNPGHLRIATRKQNMENHGGAQRNSKSGVRGVSWNKAIRRWQGEVKHHGVNQLVGYFDDLAEADAAVRARRLELFTHNDIDRIGVSA